jgi:ABC-type amino acid transport substrate-binding protein
MKAVLLALVAALPLASPSAVADLNAVKAKGVLRVIVATDEQPEMFALTAGVEPGFDRELLEGFARLNRIRLEPVVLPFDDSIPALLREEGDVIIGLVDTEARRKRIDFTTEILPTRTIVLSRKPQPPITTLEALRAARVGIVGGTSWVDAATAAGVTSARLETYDDLGGVLSALKTRRVAATVVSLVDATLAMRKDPELQTGVYLGVPGRACYGLRKRDVELRQALDAYVDGMRKAGTWSRLVVKYFGDRALSVLGRAKE